MSSLSAYTDAITKRKAINPRGSAYQINCAVLAQLEQDDIPRLLEIVRLFDLTLERCLDHGDEAGWDDIDHEAHEINKLLLEARMKIDDLADDGNKANWGEYDGNGHKDSPA